MLYIENRSRVERKQKHVLEFFMEFRPSHKMSVLSSTESHLIQCFIHVGPCTSRRRYECMLAALLIQCLLLGGSDGLFAARGAVLRSNKYKFGRSRITVRRS